MRNGKNGSVVPLVRWAVFSWLFFGCSSGRVEGPHARSGSSALPANIEGLPTPLGLDVAEQCFNATDDNANGLLDEGCGVEQGRLQFLASWQEGAVDVDLSVTGPSGQAAEVGARSSDGLTKIRDCPGEGQACQGQNQENVLLDGPDLEAGTYLVRLRLEDLGGTPPPVVVRLGVRAGGRTRGFVVELWEPGSEAFVRVTENTASFGP